MLLLVTWAAERLKGARAELIPVAAVRLDVIRDRGRLDAAFLAALGAERFLVEGALAAVE